MIDQKKIVLFDMDDTLHWAEDPTMGQVWNHLLEAFGYRWKQYDMPDQALLERGLTLITDEQRPGVGVNPRKVVEFFIDTLQLHEQELDPETFGEAQYGDSSIEGRRVKLTQKPTNLAAYQAASPVRDETTGITGLAKEWATLAEDERKARLLEILDHEREQYLARNIQENGVSEIEGASTMVTRFKEAGYAVGVVTQGSYAYAQEVLGEIGLWSGDKDERVVDVIVSGNMVENPKPHPEPLEKAATILTWNDVVHDGLDSERGKKAQYDEIVHMVREGGMKPVAMIGDSGSDAGAATAYGIPVYIIKHEHTDIAALTERGAWGFIDNPQDVTPEWLESEIQKTRLEGASRGSIERG